MTMKKVYLAGPDVFFPDIAQRATLHKQLCREKGFEPLHPADQPTLEAADIYHANIAMLQQADAVRAHEERARTMRPTPRGMRLVASAGAGATAVVATEGTGSDDAK